METEYDRARHYGERKCAQWIRRGIKVASLGELGVYGDLGKRLGQVAESIKACIDSDKLGEPDWVPRPPMDPEREPSSGPVSSVRSQQSPGVPSNAIEVPLFPGARLLKAYFVFDNGKMTYIMVHETPASVVQVVIFYRSRIPDDSSVKFSGFGSPRISQRADGAQIGFVFTPSASTTFITTSISALPPS